MADDRRAVGRAGLCGFVRGACAGPHLRGLDFEQSQPGPFPALSGLGLLPQQHGAPALFGGELQCHLPLPHQHFVYRFHSAAGAAGQAVQPHSAGTVSVFRLVGAFVLCVAGRPGPGNSGPAGRRPSRADCQGMGQCGGCRGAGAVPGIDSAHVCPHGTGCQLAGVAGHLAVAAV